MRYEFTFVLLASALSLPLSTLPRSLPDAAHPHEHAVKERSTIDARIALSDDLVRTEIRRFLSDGERLRQEHNAARIDSAVGLFDSVRVLATSRFGPQDSAVAAALFGLAICANWQGQTARCDSLLSEAVVIWTALHGERHPDIAEVLCYRAFMLPATGKFVQAEELFRQAILIFEESPESHLEELATAQHGLGWVYLNLGRHAEADSLFRLSLGTWTRMGCDRCYGAGLEYLELGITAREIGRLRESEEYLHLGLDIFRTTVGDDHHLSGIAHSEIALLLVAQGRYDEARPHLELAVKNTESNFDSASTQLVQPLSRLADLEFHDGELLAAHDYYERALRISRNMGRTPDQPLQKSLIARLATIEHLLGNDERSLAYYESACGSTQEMLRDVFSYAPEELKLWFVGQDPPINQELLTLSLEEGSEAAVRPAFEMILRGKSLVIDALAAERTTVYCRGDSALVRLEAQRSELCGEIARMTRLESQASAPTRTYDSLQIAYRMKDSLETRMAEQCAAYRIENNAVPVTIENVADKLDPDVILWEFVTYRPQPFAADAGPLAPPRYAGFALSAAGNLIAADLGTTAEIDSLIHLCRQQIQSFAGMDPVLTEREAEAQLAVNSSLLYQMLFGPFADLLGRCEQLVISPDAGLNLLPFELLQTPEGDYAIERYQISYVATGRDLLRYPEFGGSASEFAVVIADPDFDAPAQTTYSDFTHTALEVEDAAVAGHRLRGQCLDQPFWRLSTSADEGHAVARFLRESMNLDADLYTGSAASTVQLRALRESPRVLHVATHGFFCPDTDAVTTGQVPDNPLLHSGLAFAGANMRFDIRPGRQDSIRFAQGDGLLSALELSALNLVGNELTVLSACETGVGSVVSGEGVFGLRRALQHAGAQSLIVSEFAVPDETSGPLMISFYRNWAGGLSKSEALRQAALTQIMERRRTHGAAHPLFWGGFVLVGNPD